MDGEDANSPFFSIIYVYKDGDVVEEKIDICLKYGVRIIM
jgi:hypothetical protein